jgi:hypothetical protein
MVTLSQLLSTSLTPVIPLARSEHLRDLVCCIGPATLKCLFESEQPGRMGAVVEPRLPTQPTKLLSLVSRKILFICLSRSRLAQPVLHHLPLTAAPRFNVLKCGRHLGYPNKCPWRLSRTRRLRRVAAAGASGLRVL